jgi:hypothetical protein
MFLSVGCDGINIKGEHNECMGLLGERDALEMVASTKEVSDPIAFTTTQHVALNRAPYQLQLGKLRFHRLLMRSPAVVCVRVRDFLGA